MVETDNTRQAELVAMVVSRPDHQIDTLPRLIRLISVRSQSIVREFQAAMLWYIRSTIYQPPEQPPEKSLLSSKYAVPGKSNQSPVSHSGSARSTIDDS